MKNVNNERMQAFISTIEKQVSELLHERSDDLLDAWDSNIAEAQAESEATGKEAAFPPLKIGIGITVDLEKNLISSGIRFVATYKSEVSTPLPDPNQPELPMDGLKKALRPGDSVTVSIEGKEVAKFEKESPV